MLSRNSKLQFCLCYQRGNLMYVNMCLFNLKGENIDEINLTLKKTLSIRVFPFFDEVLKALLSFTVHSIAKKIKSPPCFYILLLDFFA